MSRGSEPGLPTRLREAWRDRQLAFATAESLMPPRPSAFAAFGRRSWIVPPARVQDPSHISIGDGVVIHEHAQLMTTLVDEARPPHLVIGDGCNIGPMAHIACAGDIVLEENVLTAARIFIGDTSHGYEDPDRDVIFQPMTAPLPVRIGRGAFLGIGSVVLPGVTIGEHGYVAAGAVVTDDVAPRTLVAGNPARPLRRWVPASGRWERC